MQGERDYYLWLAQKIGSLARMGDPCRYSSVV